MREDDDDGMIDSIYQDIVGATASGFSMLGNALSLPGSMIRDAMVFDNPFDQLLSPLSHIERGKSATGRDVLDYWELTDKNMEGGVSDWWENPSEAGADTAGFLLEMGTDPFSWLSGGLAAGATKAATKAGAKAGAKAAAKGAGKGARIKRAAGKAAKTAGDAFDIIDPGWHIGRAIGKTDRGAKWIKRVKQSPSDAMSAVAKQVNKTEIGARLQQNLETAKMYGRGAFDASTGGKKFTEVQDYEASVRGAVNRRMSTDAMNDIQNLTGAIIDHLGKSPSLDTTHAGTMASIRDIQKSISSAAELNNWKGIPVGIAKAAKKIKANDEALHYQLADAGARPKFFEDHMVQFDVREMADNVMANIDMNTQHSVHGGANVDAGLGKRVKLFRGGDKENWNKLTSDPEIHQALKAGEGLAAERMKAKYGKVIDGRLLDETKDGKWFGVDENGVRHEFEPADVKQDVDYSAGDITLDVPADPAGDPSDVYTVKLSHSDRFEAVEKWLRSPNSPDSDILMESGGVYNDQWMAINARRQAAKIRFLEELNSLPGFLADARRRGSFNLGSKVVTDAGLGKAADGVLMKDMFHTGAWNNIDKKKIFDKLADVDPDHFGKIRDGFDDVEKYYEHMDDYRLRKDVFNALTGKRISNSEGALEAIEEAFRSTTVMFKMGVLTHPARVGRDFTGAQLNNILAGRWDYESFWAAKNVATNQGSEALLDLPEVKNWLKIAGMKETPANAAEVLRRRYAGSRLDPTTGFKNLPGIETQLANAHSFEDLARARPGSQQLGEGILGFAKEWYRTIKKKKGPNATWKPWHIAGLRRGGVSPSYPIRTANDFIPAQMIEDASKLSDDMGRLTAIISGMKRGESFEDAFKAAEHIQINYSPANLTPMLKKMKSVFPFLTFDNGMVRYLARRLVTHPSGGHGKAIRLQQKGQDPSDPEHIRQMGGIKYHEAEDGETDYYTTNALMHSGPVGKLGDGSVQNVLENVMSGANPLVKAPFELALGKSLFMNKPLQDLDPSVGRIIRNAKWWMGKEVPEGKAKPFLGSHNLEYAISASPASRIVNTVKKLTDTRHPIWRSALEQATGATRRVTVSPWMLEREKAQQMERIARKLGVSSFSTTSVRHKDVENAPDVETKEALEAIRKYQSRQRRIKRKFKQNQIK